jgi:hypothetical protein
MKLDRFLRLERARKECEPESQATPRRFATLEAAPAAKSPASRSSARLERFVPEPPPPLELEAPDTAEPFVRCLHCGADSIRHALVCRQCEASLDTDEVRAFNERLWVEVTAAREREAEELRQRAELRRGIEAPQDEALAAEFAAREHARRAFESASARTSTGMWGQTSGRSLGGPRLLLWVLAGLPVLYLLTRRGAFGVGPTLVFAIGAALFVVFRRAR